MASSRGRAVTLGVMVVLAGLALAACADSGNRYVKSSSDGLYFTIPDEWELYDEDAVLEYQEGDLSPGELETQRETGWQVFFDAAPRPTIEHLGELITDHPNGQAQVIELGTQARDTISLETLRNIVFPIDQIAEADPSLVEIVDGEEINDGDLRGIQFVFTVDSRVPSFIETGELEPGDRDFATFSQTAVIDADTRRLYVLVISCEAGCYEENEDTIDKIADSWTVEEPR